jgi:hypothetical protein
MSEEKKIAREMEKDDLLKMLPESDRVDRFN